MIHALLKLARMGISDYRFMYMISLLAIPAAGYTAYAFIARKFLSGSEPFLWIVTLVVADIAMGIPYLSNMRFIIMFTTGTWLTCMIIYFIEWLVTSKAELVDRRLEFRNLAIIAILFFVAYASIDSYVTFTTTSHKSGITFITIFLLFGGYKLLNAFGGISEGKCRKDLGSSRQGDKYITYFQELTGDEAVLFGIRSAMIWLSIGALWVNISPFIK